MIQTPCWMWDGIRDRGGYGKVYRGGKMRLAHRVVYETLGGSVSGGKEMDHLCRNPGCVRPDHLEPVTHRENMLRGDTFTSLETTKTHCPQGHPYDEANTYVFRGGRTCRACRHQRAVRHRKANPEHYREYDRLYQRRRRARERKAS